MVLLRKTLKKLHKKRAVIRIMRKIHFDANYVDPSFTTSEFIAKNVCGSFAFLQRDITFQLLMAKKTRKS